MALMFAAMLLPDRTDQQSAAAAQTQSPQLSVSPAAPSRPVSLRDRLIVGLKALRPVEVAYVENVVTKVQIGQLPQRLVDETFFWARERADNGPRGQQRRPIIYFQPAMTARALRAGVVL
jgi:hypothetical protein